jgi:hypothetical protein
MNPVPESGSPKATDRLAQTKEATKEFVALLESQLAAIHPAYQRNRLVKGIRHEYFRELQAGLFAIHSVICVKGTYYHCFCLSYHRTPVSPYLYSPFTVGGRCDHNYTVTTGCHRDLGLSPIDPIAPFRMSALHRFRTGADRIMQRCLTEAEARLLPFYFSVCCDVRPSLQALLDFCAATPLNKIAACAAMYPGVRHELSCHMLGFRRLHDAVRPELRPAFFAATAMTIPEIITAMSGQSSA